MTEKAKRPKTKPTWTDVKATIEDFLRVVNEDEYGCFWG